ncbi:hypothetical protein [Phenylobacterium sp.]|uniref:hypothetical protein n=1 Tax=Phenylobacterium sp. TaxID=1871053 RepID=UPI0030F3CB3A
MFGGDSRFVGAWLSDLTHDPPTPAWCMLAFSTGVLPPMLALQESSPGKTVW